MSGWIFWSKWLRIRRCVPRSPRWPTQLLSYPPPPPCIFHLNDTASSAVDNSPPNLGNILPVVKIWSASRWLLIGVVTPCVSWPTSFRWPSISLSASACIFFLACRDFFVHQCGAIHFISIGWAVLTEHSNREQGTAPFQGIWLFFFAEIRQTKRRCK